MPIYEYKCGECGHQLEAIQKLSEDPLKECPACGRPELKRLISAAGFQLKGTGWYATDFKNKGQKKEEKKDSKQEQGDKSGSSGSGEAAPEKKAHGGGACSCH